MRAVKLVVVLCLAACGGDKQIAATGSGSGGSGSGSGSGAALDICKIGLAAIDSASCPAPAVSANLAKARKTIDGLATTAAKITDDPSKLYVMCAQLLLAIERDAKQAGCTLAIPADARTDIAKTLDAFYAQRTPVAPTGDAASDAVISRFVAIRDAACECKDAACLDRVDRQLVTISPLPDTAPAAAKTLAGKLLEDSARCAQRVRTSTP
jgi:hypothetical protein